MEAGGARPAVSQQLGAAAGEWLVGTTGEIALFHADRGEHRAGECHVFRFAAMRTAGEGELVVTPADLIEPATREQRHDLERLGARAPVRHEGGIVRGADQFAGSIDDRRMDPVARFHECSAGGDDVEGQLVHCRSAGR